MGLQSVAKDLGFSWSVRMHTDATAAIGICHRRGLGKIRHLAVADLWIQDKVRGGDIVLQKILGTNNPADMCTKYISKLDMERHLKKISCRWESGRADSAPTVDQ